jgi:hypothetical protein
MVEPGAGTLGLRVGRAVERIDHVVGRQLPSVVEFHALAGHVGVVQSIRRDVERLREVGPEIRRAGLVVHEPAVEALDHRPVLPVVADCRVERRHVVLEGDGHLAALLDVVGKGRRSG